MPIFDFMFIILLLLSSIYPNRVSLQAIPLRHWNSKKLQKIKMTEEVADGNPRFFVAVHVGAGFHSPSNEKALRSAMKRACLAAASVLRKVSLSLWLVA